MKKLAAVLWRSLLALALVVNPLAPALAMPCMDAPSHQAKSDATPPCHHAHSDAAAKAAHSDLRGHDCGKAGCNFGACCSISALVGAPIWIAPLIASSDTGYAEGARALVGPPLPPLIRPPIT
jgi:hypothetical protein